MVLLNARPFNSLLKDTLSDQGWILCIDAIPRMVLGAFSTAYQGKSSEPANPLQTVYEITDSAGSPNAQTRKHHAGS